MLIFIVPVKSKTVTSDWAAFSRLVNRSINSICNQSNTNFKVIVACHEIPETKFNDDSRVEFLKVDFSPPILKNNAEDNMLKEFDKGKKIKFAAAYAMKIRASYIMTVDSDDCISNKICEFVSKNGNHSILGWYVKKGYLYTEGKRYAFLNFKNFNTICGSSVIIKPELIDLMYRNKFWFKHERTIFEDGLSLLPLPFPGSLYSMLNGTNIALDKEGMKSRTTYKLSNLESIKSIFRRLGKYMLVPKAYIKKEFSVYDV